MTDKILPNDVEYYYKKNRFLSLLISTRKWRDLILSKEALVSISLAFITTYIVNNIYSTLATKDFCNFIGYLLLTTGIGLIGMLGFLVSGMAIISGTIGNKILKNINSERKFDKIISIVFSFYFDGALIGITLVLFFFTYLSLQTNWMISVMKVHILSFGAAYLFWFVVTYSIMLLGTLLRLLILTYRYDYDEETP